MRNMLMPLQLSANCLVFFFILAKFRYIKPILRSFCLISPRPKLTQHFSLGIYANSQLRQLWLSSSQPPYFPTKSTILLTGQVEPRQGALPPWTPDISVL